MTALVQIDGTVRRGDRECSMGAPAGSGIPLARLARARWCCPDASEGAPLREGALVLQGGTCTPSPGVVTKRKHSSQPIRMIPRDKCLPGGLNDADRAFAALERAVPLHWWRAATWMHRPEVAILRGDPRLATLKKRMVARALGESPVHAHPTRAMRGGRC